jgi:pyridoxine 5-phosphate synthase
MSNQPKKLQKIGQDLRKTSKRPATVRLGVNIDHAATLRKVRGNTTAYPDLLNLAKIAKKAGADQITVHLREDRRHIQDQDVIELCKARTLPINLELALNPQIFRLACRVKPDQACFVPEKRQELTTEGGLNLHSIPLKKRKWIDDLHKMGIKPSAFIEPDLEQVKLAAQIGFSSVEFHTGHWVKEFAKNRKSKKTKALWKKLVSASELAHAMGLAVHAGHGLDLLTTQEILKLPYLEEVNIGHSIICYSLEWGLEKTIKKFKAILKHYSQCS